LSISGCVVGMGKSNLRRQARSESALSCSRKYRNPERRSETWVGRGKKSRWLAAHLKSGKRIDDFRISHAARRQISWPDWLRLSEPAYAMPAPRPAVWRGLRPLHGLASVRLRISLGSVARCFRRHRGCAFLKFSPRCRCSLTGRRLVPARHNAHEDRSRFHFWTCRAIRAT
jgi:hypothetical protein